MRALYWGIVAALLSFMSVGIAIEDLQILTMEEATNWIDLGDRSHPNLKLVDKLKRKLTYDGNKNDLKELEQAHFGRGRSFDEILHRVKEKEKMSKIPPKFGTSGWTH